MQYVSQTKTLTGVIFDYANEDHVVESLFYSNTELVKMAEVSPEFDQACKSITKE